MNSSSVTEVIIGLSAGLEWKTKNDPPYMWIGNETRLRAAAAAKLWNQNKSALIIFSGGHPTGGMNIPSEASTMEDYAKREPWNVPADRIITENKSIDTASNIRNVVKIMRTRKLPTNNITLIGGTSNLYRAAAYCRAYCIFPKALMARPVLGSDIEKYHLPDVSDAMSPRAKFNEFLLRVEQIFDRKGYLVTAFKRWSLNRNT